MPRPLAWRTAPGIMMFGRGSSLDLTSNALGQPRGCPTMRTTIVSIAAVLMLASAIVFAQDKPKEDAMKEGAKAK